MTERQTPDWVVLGAPAPGGGVVVYASKDLWRAHPSRSTESGGAVSTDVWAKLRQFDGDVNRYAAAVEQCGRRGHVYRLHATKGAPVRVTCKQCPAVGG